MTFSSFHSIKNGTRIYLFWRKWLRKNAFHKNKRAININEGDIERIKLSDKKSFNKDSFKYFIGYGHEGNAFHLHYT